MTAPFYLIAQPNDFEWHKVRGSIDDLTKAMDGMDIEAVYEAEPRDHMAPMLSDISEKAAKTWVEKNQAEIEFDEDGDSDCSEFIKKFACDDLRRLFDDGEAEATATRRDQAMLMQERA
jgi:hypothetical protein